MMIVLLVAVTIFIRTSCYWQADRTKRGHPLQSCPMLERLPSDCTALHSARS